MSRELDVQVATEVFGLVKCTSDHQGGAPAHWEYCYARPETPNRGGELSGYSTDLVSAFEVEAWLFERGWRVVLTHEKNGAWCAHVTRDGWGPVFIEKSLPEVICRAALKVARLEKEASNG